jgi:hypothetical protein
MTPEGRNSGARLDSIARQRLDKHVSVTTPINGIIAGKVVFYWVLPRLYNVNPSPTYLQMTMYYTTDYDGQKKSQISDSKIWSRVPRGLGPEIDCPG